MMRKSLAIAVILLFAAGICQAGSWLEDTLINTGKRLGERAIGETGSGAYKGAKDAATGTGKKTAKDPKAPPAAGTGEDSDGGQAAKQASGKHSPSAGDAVGSSGPSSGAVSIEQAETIYSKYDFVPGDKTIYFDDFSDTD